MGLRTYRDCTFREKRDVLRVFWSRRRSESDKITRAAHEYAPYALGLVALITAELAVIAVVLVAHASQWAWVATAATVLAAWSLVWTVVCQRHLKAITSAQ